MTHINFSYIRKLIQLYLIRMIKEKKKNQITEKIFEHTCILHFCFVKGGKHILKLEVCCNCMWFKYTVLKRLTNVKRGFLFFTHINRGGGDLEDSVWRWFLCFALTMITEYLTALGLIKSFVTNSQKQRTKNLEKIYIFPIAKNDG